MTIIEAPPDEWAPTYRRVIVGFMPRVRVAVHSLRTGRRVPRAVGLAWASARLHPRRSTHESIRPRKRHMRMNLFLLSVPRDSIGYDEHDGFVVRALSERGARTIAVAAARCNADDFRGRATCTVLAENVVGKPGVVLASYNAG